MNMCLRRRIKRTLSDLAGVQKRAPRERLISLLVYELVARHTRAKEGTKFGAKLRSQSEETQVMLGNDSEDSVLCEWRMSPIDDIAYAGWKVSAGFKEFEKEDLYF